MQLKVVLFLCVTSFIRVRGQQQGESVVLSLRENDSHRACTRMDMQMHGLGSMAMDAKCHKPREKLVNLLSDMGDADIMPSQVYLKRCDCDVKCADGGQCVPLMETSKKQMISVSFRGSSKRKCISVELPEHEDCQCKCIKTIADCNKELQLFNSDSCSCKCIDEHIHEADCKKKNRKWNKETCMCNCPNNMRRCSSGFTWSMEYCDCVKVEMKMGQDGTPIGPEIQDNNV